jgi:hypothetical protein
MTSSENIQPRIPFTILCAGDGSRYSPFQFDLSDPLIKYFSEIFGTKWFNFIAKINSSMRNLIFKDKSSLKIFQVMEEYVNMMESVGIGIGKSLPIGGVHLELIIVPPKHSNDLARPALFLRHPINYKEIGKESITSDENQNYSSIENSAGLASNWLFSDYEKTCIDSVYSFFRELLFVRKESSSFFKTRMLIFSLFILGEIGLNLSIITIFASLWPLSFWIYMFVFPAANLLSPLFGIATLVLRSVVMARIYASFNAFSFLNSFIALGFGIYGVFTAYFTLLYGVFLPSFLIIVKLAISQLHLRYLPYLEHEQDMTISRVDILRGEMSSRSPRSLRINDD